jgi:carboxymethylenebutenolidase
MCYPNGDTVVYVGNHVEQSIEVPGSDLTLPTYAYNYVAQENRPVIIVLHDIYGPNQFYRDTCARLAEEGFAVLLPDLFVRQGVLSENSMQAAFARSSRHSFPLALDDIATLADHLHQTGRKVALLGFCMGGTLTMLAASRLQTLKAGVVYYGFPVNANPTPNRPANPLDEVGNLTVPLLGFFGGKDSGVGPENVKVYQQAARKAGKNVKFTLYRNAGHAFLSFDPASPTAKDSLESWTLTVAFLKRQLDTEIVL